MSRSRIQKGLTLSLFSLVGVLAVLGILEAVLRAREFDFPPADEPIAIWNPKEDRELRLGLGLHRSVPRQLWEPRPDALIPPAWTREPERVNEAAYRGPERAETKTPGTLRIATLGDSSTFGYAVPYAATYSAELEALLLAAGEQAEVLDFGVIGFSLLQGIERYRERVRAFRPDLVIAAFGAVNDHHMAQGLSDAQKIAAGMGAGNAWVELSRTARRELRVLHWIAWLAHEPAEQDPALVEAEMRRLIAIEATRPHVGLMEFESLHGGTRRVSPAEFEAGLAELARLVEADGASLILISMPRRPGVDIRIPVLRYYSHLINAFASRSATLLCDARADFREYRELERGDPNLFFVDGDDFHPSKRGHARIAKRLSELILEWKESH